jgi:hypothetical protein
VVDSVFLTGCISIFGMMVDAAIVEAAYVDGAYPWLDLVSMDMADAE